SRVTMYAPPAVGYSLIVSRYDKIRNASTTSMAMVIGTTSENAATPMAGTRMCRISSVAYAEDDRLSEAKTARAVGRPNRSWMRAEVCSGLPRRTFLSRNPSGGRSSSGASTARSRAGSVTGSLPHQMQADGGGDEPRLFPELVG